MICKYCGESFQKQGNTDGSCPASTDGNQRHATKPSEQFQHLIDSAAASQQQEKEQFQHLIDSAAASLELEKSCARREERERKEKLEYHRTISTVTPLGDEPYVVVSCLLVLSYIVFSILPYVVSSFPVLFCFVLYQKREKIWQETRGKNKRQGDFYLSAPSLC
jgi:hypothetical protein